VLNNRPMDDVFITENLLTSLTLTNLEATPTPVTLQVYGIDGQPVPAGRREFTIGPMQQLSQFLDAVLGSPFLQAGGYITIQSRGKLLASEVILAGDLSTRDYFVILPPQTP